MTAPAAGLTGRPSGGLRELAVIATGGVIGAEARYGVGRLEPSGPHGFPWATFLINVAGGFAIGVLMAVLVRTPQAPVWVRPFAGVGVLGGFTTFSTYSTDTYRLIDAGRPGTALAYAGLTLVTVLAVTVAGLSVGAALIRRRPERPDGWAGAVPDELS